MPVHYTPTPVYPRPGGGGGASLGPGLPAEGGGIIGVGGGISGATLKARDALLAQKRAAWEARPADEKAGFRTDAQGNRYWYQPGMTPEQEHNPVNSQWAYGVATPPTNDSFALRRYAAQGAAPLRAIPAYTPPPPPGAGPGDASPPLQSVVDSPSTHPYTAPAAPGEGTLPPSGTGGPIPPIIATSGYPGGGGSVPGPMHGDVMPAPAAPPRYFPIGQSTPGYGGASTPLQVAGPAGPGGAAGAAGGPKPAGTPGFDPATAPSSAQAKQQGSAYQARQSTSERQMQTNQALAQPGGANPYNRRYTAANPYQPTPARY